MGSASSAGGEASAERSCTGAIIASPAYARVLVAGKVLNIFVPCRVVRPTPPPSLPDPIAP